MKAVISIGSNLGNRPDHLVDAVSELAKLSGTQILHASSIYETEPQGNLDQPSFYNGIIVLDCDLEAEVLLNHLQQIESRALRQRLVANGPRTLDLDLIAVDDLVMHSRSLELPHPRAAKRRFVLEPWFEVEPEAEIPGVGKVAELLKQVSDQGVAKLERLQLL